MKIKMMILALILVLGLGITPAFAGADADAKAKAEATGIQVTDMNVISPQQLPGALTIIPNPIPLIQGGRVGDVTAQVVKFAIAAKPYNGEPVIRVLKVVSGSIFDRVRLEDIETDLLKAYADVAKSANPSKIRYLVQYKDSAMGAGIGGGGAGSLSNLGGGSSPLGVTGSAAILPGYTRSTADPAYFIKFFEVE